MKLYSKFIIFLAILTSSVFAQNGLEAIKKDLQQSGEKLTKQRAELSAERIKLSSEFTAIQNELVTARRQARLARMSDADRKEAMRQLESNATAQVREKEFLGNQISAYSGKLASTLLKGEPNVIPDSSELDQRMLAIEAGLSRLEKVIGGTLIEADGVDPEGAVKPGKIAMIGPAMWFRASDKSFQGEVVLTKGDRLAKVIREGNENVAQIFSGDEVSATIDLTGGKARALANIYQSPLDLFRKGGTWVWPIIAVAFIALVCAILKFLQLSKIKNPDPGWLSGVLEKVRAGDSDSLDEAIASCDSLKHPVGVVMSESLTGYHKGADMVEDMIYERMISVQEKLRKWLPFIAVTAAIAPLLGLLGTVSGMIGTFNVISVAGTGDPKPMAGGISEALVTTFFGLVVAIPALLLHSLLSRRSQGIVQTTEKLGLRIVNSIRKNSK